MGLPTSASGSRTGATSDVEAGTRSSTDYVQRQQQKQQQHGGSGQAPGAPFSSSARQEDHQQPRSLTRAVNEGLGEDIYAIFVGSVIAYFASAIAPPRDHRCRLYRLGALVLFTAGLQMTLILLLWMSASNGIPSPEQHEKYMIWKQFGNVNQAVCQLRRAAGLASVELRPGPDVDQTCADFWPDIKTYSKLPDYTKAENCFSKPPSEGMSSSECANALISLNWSMRAYGWGFFSSRTTSEQPSRLGSRWKEPGGLFLGGWDGDSLDDGDPFFCIACAYILLAIVVHGEVKTAARLCFTAAVAAGIVPEFYGLMPGPCCWRSRQPRMHRDLPKDELHRGVCALILLAPLLQMLVAVCVMATAGMLFVLQMGQSDSVQIIVNSVALAFIVELDNYVGSLVAKGWRNSVVLQPAPAQRMPQLRCRDRGWGVVYFAVVGMFLFIEVVLLSPQSSATLLEFAALVLNMKVAPGSGFGSPGLRYKFMDKSRIRPGFWFEPSLWFMWAFGGWMDAATWFHGPGKGQLTDFGTGPKQQMAFLVFALVMYALASAVVVAFVFSRTIPSVSRRWQGGLMTSQLLLTLVIQLQSSNFHRECFGGDWTVQAKCRSRGWWWLVVLLTLFVAWAGMFVIWPLCFAARCKQQQRTGSHAVASAGPPAAAAAGVVAAAARGTEPPAQEQRPLPSQLTLEQRLEGAEAEARQLLEAAQQRLSELEARLGDLERRVQEQVQLPAERSDTPSDDTAQERDTGRPLLGPVGTTAP